MTVEAAKLMWSRARGTLDTDGGPDTTIRFRDGYTIVATVDERQPAIMSAPDLPRKGEAYPGNPFVTVKQVTVEKMGPVFWMALVTWEGRWGEGPTDDPWNQEPEQEFRNLRTNQQIDIDINNKPIATANDEPIHGLTEDIVDWVLVVKRFYQLGAISVADIHPFFHSVNDDIVITRWGSFARGLGKLTRFDVRGVYQDGVPAYDEVQAEITFRYPYGTEDKPHRAWWKRTRHEGYLVRDLLTDRIFHAVDKNDDKVTRPVLLSEAGDRWTEFDPDPPFLFFQTVNYRDYSLLGLI